MRVSSWFQSAVLLAAVCGCTGGTPAQPVQAGTPAAGTPAAGSPAEPVNDTLARLRALANPACTEDSQCRTLPLGASPCGGPEGYLPWSSARTPADALQALGERYREARRTQNQAAGRMGACRFSPDPGAVCRAGTCRLGTPGFQVQ